MFVTWSGLLHAGKQHLADIKHMAAVCVQLRPSPRLAHAASLAMGTIMTKIWQVVVTTMISFSPAHLEEYPRNVDIQTSREECTM